MRRWFNFFVGTPQRFLGTLVGVGFIVCLIDPEIFQRAINQAIGAVVMALQPLLSPILTIVIVFAGIKMILGGGGKGGKK